MGFPQQLPTAHSWDPRQPPRDIPCHSPPLPHGLRGHSPQGCWAEGTCARSGAGGGEGLGAAQQGRTRCGTNVRGDPQRGWSRGDVTCVELRAVDRSHHWVQLPACGQGEPVRPGASSPRCSPPPRLCSKGPRLPSPVSCWAWGARGGAASLHWAGSGRSPICPRVRRVFAAGAQWQPGSKGAQGCPGPPQLQLSSCWPLPLV